MPRVVRLVTALALSWLACFVVEAAHPIEADKLLVGIVVDTRSENMTNDALLMLRSLRMFGGTAANVDVVATLVHHNFSELTTFSRLREQFADLGVQTVLHAPAFAPLQQTCNKFFAFEAFQVYGKRRHQWYLYLDTDVVIMQDFLAGLEVMFNDTSGPAPELLCFPSWDYYMTWPASIFFNTILQETFDPPPRWDRDHPVAHCNTGVIFMTARAMRDLWKETHYILYSELAPWMTNPHFVTIMDQFSHVDSWALAVAAYRIGLEVGALPVEWNYLVAADTYIKREVGVPSEERQIKILHFLAETRLAFSVVPDCNHACNALLVLRNATETGPTLQAVRPFINHRETCLKLAGCAPVHYKG